MTKTLRPDQKDFKKRVVTSLLKNERILAVAPTGYGKSFVMSTIATGAATAKNPKAVLIVTESIKIYDQLATELPIVDINAGIKDVHIVRGKVYLAMSQTLSKRPKMIEEFVSLGHDLLIITDEAHIGTPYKLLLQFKESALMIGFTATPDWLVAKHLPELYNDCVVACQVDEVIQAGNLCTYRHIARDKANTDILELRNGDYTEKSQNKAFGTEQVYDGLIEDLRDYPFNKAMVFCASIESCEKTYARLVENGFKVCRFHSGNKDYPLKNPDFELARFTTFNQCNICVSVGSLTKGFDYKPIDAVFLLRKTKSLPLYLQMIGRASRTVKAHELHEYPFMTEPKTEFLLFDYGSHWKDKRLGTYWEDRDWENMWQARKTSKSGEGVATVKACEGCDELIPAIARICPKCGYEYPVIEKELEIGERVEITMSYTALVGLWVSELSPVQLSVYAKIKSKKKHSIRVALAREYEQQGFIKRFGEAMGFKKDFIYMLEIESSEGKVEFHDTKLK